MDQTSQIVLTKRHCFVTPLGCKVERQVRYDVSIIEDIVLSHPSRKGAKRMLTELIANLRRAYKLRRNARHRRMLRAMGVVLTAPKADERSSIELHKRIMSP